MTTQDFVDQARRTRAGPPGRLSSVLLHDALREVLGCMLAAGAGGRGQDALNVGARLLAAVISYLEDAGPTRL